MLGLHGKAESFWIYFVLFCVLILSATVKLWGTVNIEVVEVLAIIICYCCESNV